MNKFTLNDLLYSKLMMFLYFLLVLLTDCYIYFNSILNKIILMSVMILSLFLLFIYIISGKYNKWINLLIIYCIIGGISSYLGEYSNVYDFFVKYIKIIGISIYLNTSLESHTEKAIKTLNIVYCILVLINFLTIVIFPYGLFSDSLYSNNWFFLYDNMHIFMFLPAILINLLVGKYKRKKRLSLMLEFVIITYCVFYCFSANSVVSYCIFISFLFLYKIVKKIKILNSKNYFITYIIMFFLIVVFKIQEIFRWLIVVVLKKDMTFSSRTILWEKVITFIKRNPILGYGEESTAIFSEKMGSVNFTHAHNTILDVTYRYGIIGAILHILMILIPVKKLYNFKENDISKIISISLFCLLITCLFEARVEKLGLYIILVLGLNIEKIIQSVNHKKGEYNVKEKSYL